jgi:hypothetical protein
LGGLRPLTGQRRAAGRAELGAWRRGSAASCTFFFIHVFHSFFKSVLLLVFQAFFRFQDPKCASVRPYMVVLIFASFLRATSVDCVDLAPPATFMRGQSGAVIFGRVHQPYRIQPTRRVPTEQAELPEFWRKTPAVVTGIRLRMAKAIFPYLQRYRSKGLTDTGANVVLTTQTQRDVFLFHVRLTAGNSLATTPVTRPQPVPSGPDIALRARAAPPQASESLSHRFPSPSAQDLGKSPPPLTEGRIRPQRALRVRTLE